MLYEWITGTLQIEVVKPIPELIFFLFLQELTLHDPSRLEPVLEPINMPNLHYFFCQIVKLFKRNSHRCQVKGRMSSMPP